MFLRFDEVCDKSARGDGGVFVPAKPQHVHRGDGELVFQAFFCVCALKGIGQITGERGKKVAFELQPIFNGKEKFIVADDLRDRKIEKRGDDGVQALFLGAVELPRRDIRPCKRIVFSALESAGDEIILSRVQKALFGDRPRRNDADDVPLYHPLALFGIGELFADRDFLPRLEELLDVIIRGMIGHAAHGSPLFLAAVSARKRQIEDLACLFGVLEKHLVKVAEAIKDYTIGMSVFDLAPMLHHG